MSQATKVNPEQGKDGKIKSRVYKILNKYSHGKTFEFNILIVCASYPLLVIGHNLLFREGWWGAMKFSFWAWIPVIILMYYFHKVRTKNARIKAAHRFNLFFPDGDRRNTAISVLQEYADNQGNSYSVLARSLLEELGEFIIPVEPEAGEIFGNEFQKVDDLLNAFKNQDGFFDKFKNQGTESYNAVVTEKVIINGKEVVNKKVIKDGKEISNEEYYVSDVEPENKIENQPPVKKVKQETNKIPVKTKPVKKTGKYIPLDPESGGPESKK